MDKTYRVASADMLRGFEHVQIDNDALDHVPATEQANTGKIPAATKGVRFTPSTVKPVDDDSSSGTEVFTHSRDASWSTSSPISAIPDSMPSFQAPYETELLRPARYNDTPSFVVNEAENVPASTSSNNEDLAIDTTSHLRNASESSTSSRRTKKQEHDLYFTPDIRRSKFFFSSPKPSPTLPLESTYAADNPTPTSPESTPPISIDTRRVNIERTPTPKRQEKLKITPVQLDKLVTALASSRMVQKHVRKYWWDVEDIPDDETVASMETVSTPTLTTASTLYSRANENFISESHTPEVMRAILEEEFARDYPNHPKAKLPPPPPRNPSFGGVALSDPKVHGSPIRFLSKGYKLGSKPVSVGSCSFLQVPYGTEVECSLFIQHPSPTNARSRIMLQCVNQVVDRKTGKRTYLLAASIDVTPSFISASLAEFAARLDKPISDVSIISSPTSALPIDSPDIDWAALADELQATAHAADTIDTTIANVTQLDAATCTDQTTALLATLDQIKDQHTDFIILRSTAFHANGVPSKIGLPFVSQRLYHDWYETEAAHGSTKNAKAFQLDIVEAVSRQAAVEGGAGKFTANVKWGEVLMVVVCVPLSESAEGRADAWACFVKGEADLG